MKANLKLVVSIVKNYVSQAQSATLLKLIERGTLGLSKAIVLSGEGKRMHRLILRLLCYSPNPTYREEAKKLLENMGFFE